MAAPGMKAGASARRPTLAPAADGDAGASFAPFFPFFFFFFPVAPVSYWPKFMGDGAANGSKKPGMGIPNGEPKGGIGGYPNGDAALSGLPAAAARNRSLIDVVLIGSPVGLLPVGCKLTSS